MQENSPAYRYKFNAVVQQAYALFGAQFGDMSLDELRHVLISEFRERQLDLGLHASSVRRYIKMSMPW